MLEDDVMAYDCVELDPALRRVDEAADLAFLVMELVARGADALTQELLAAYRAEVATPATTRRCASTPPTRRGVRAKVAYLAGEPPTQAAGMQPEPPGRP